MLSEGIVIKANGEFITVGVKRRTACDTCRADCKGGHCDKVETVETVVKNTLDAKVGDRVRLYTNTSTVMVFAMTVFMLPMIIAAACFAIPYFLGAGITASAIIATLGFVLSYALIWLIHRNRKSYDTIKLYDITERKND
ncbi:MAG: hypothetical protein E7613_07525 [Ruminococcaceae bacterium]|nr:hypothetical protein [Oscillospiraceae bacterium]